jgi:acetyl esterase/lipase
VTATPIPPQIIPLWPQEPPGSAPGDTFRPWLEPYLAPAGRSTRGTVLVLPGGGYGGRAAHEAAVVARRFNAAGLHAAVLHYRVAPNRHPAPLMDAARGLRLLRQRAAAWSLDPGRIAVLGFSAGGHLAASLGTLHARYPFAAEDDLAAVSNRPDALLLCYAVLSSGICGHGGSFANLLGPRAGDPACLAELSLEKQVSADTPPTFLWHTSDDAAVPVQNSLLFATALREQGVPFELHVFPHGRHGLGLADQVPAAAVWPELACRWLLDRGW